MKTSATKPDTSPLRVTRYDYQDARGTLVMNAVEWVDRIEFVGFFPGFQDRNAEEVRRLIDWLNSVPAKFDSDPRPKAMITYDRHANGIFLPSYSGNAVQNRAISQ